MNDAAATLLAQARALDVEERLALVAAIWDSIANDTQPRVEALPAWHGEVLDQRLAELALDPDAESSWDEVRANLESLSDSPHGHER